MKKNLLLSVMIITVLFSNAQSSTIVTPATNCFPYHNFNTTNEGFSSPSIYSDGNDVSFSWDAVAGNEIETSGLSVRNASLISPVYMQTTGSVSTIGFKYVAPIGAEYRIRIISAVAGAPLEILATTANGPVWTVLPALSGTVCILLTDADLTTGSMVRIEFTFRVSQPGNVIFDDFATAVANAPLPVTFEGFVARKNTDGSLKLLWNVGLEQNVQGYYVENSTNGRDFTSIGYVTATGKSIYSLDQAILKQTMYFRVRNLDIDGKSKYSPIIRIYAKEQTDAQIQIYPMPASDQVTIQHKQASEKSLITLYSMDGRILQQVIAIPFTLQTQINIQSLVNGIYIIRYNDGQGDVQSAKLVKSK